MKVIISLKKSWKANKVRGVGSYTRELIASLTDWYPESEFVPTSHDFYALHGDLIHFPYFDPFFLTLPLRHKIPTVVTVHDVIPLKYPRHFKKGFRGYLKWRIQRTAARRADRIITDSVASATDITRIMKIPKKRITVIPLAPAGEPLDHAKVELIRDKFNLPDRYLLYVGDINWNKNVVGLIEVFGKLADSKLHLVLVGKSFEASAHIPEGKAVLKAISQSGASDRVHILGYVPPAELPGIYAAATLYVQPSWDEGFGLPVLEAMTVGCPVACSNRGSLPEVGGDAVAYFDPAKDMGEVIFKLIRSSKLRDALKKKGYKQVINFSWHEVARLTYGVYEEVLGARS